MRPQPHPVSQFILHPQHFQPHVPLLIRSRHRPRLEKQLHQPHPLHPQEFIIDVNSHSFKLPTQRPLQQLSPRHTQPQQAEGIRKHIDDCLNAIEIAYKQQKFQQLLPHAPNNQQTPDRTIHRIDPNLVMEYTRTICQDYKIKDRFGQQLQPQRPITSDQKTPIVASPDPNQYRQRSQSVGPQARKQFINITLATQQDRRGVSVQKPKPQPQTNPRTHRQTSSLHRSYPIQSNDTPPSHQQQQFVRPRSAVSGIIQKIDEDFRYCINCQSSILTRNVDYHEQYECKDFPALYKLSFTQLTTHVGKKIERMNQQLKKKLAWLKQYDENKRKRCDQICNQTLQRIQEYVNESINDSTTVEYSNFKQSLNNQYAQAIKITHKLHWFNQILIKLKSQTQKREVHRNIIWQNRPPSLPVNMPLSYQRLQGVVPHTPKAHLGQYSPIVQFSPSTTTVKMSPHTPIALMGPNFTKITFQSPSPSPPYK